VERIYIWSDCKPMVCGEIRWVYSWGHKIKETKTISTTSIVKDRFLTQSIKPIMDKNESTTA
jgi:hypothetical protein